MDQQGLPNRTVSMVVADKYALEIPHRQGYSILIHDDREREDRMRVWFTLLAAVAALGLTGGWRGFTASLGVATTGFRTVAIEVSVGYAWRVRGAVFAGRP